MTQLVVAFAGDDKPRVTRLVKALEGRGYVVKWQGNMPTANWKLWMRQQMQSAAAVILVLSKAAVAREETGLFEEGREAISKLRMRGPLSEFLVPVRMDDCIVPPFPIDADSTLESINYLDLFPEAEWDATIERIVKMHPPAPNPR